MPVNEWHRVSPIALVYFLLDGLRQAVSLWPVLVPALAGGERFRSLFLSVGLPGLIVLFVGSVFAHFWFFRYRIEDDRIQLHTGVFRRKRLTLYFERVQQADIAQPFYFRPFRLATLGLESAGSRQQEIQIPGLAYSDARELKNLILEHHRATLDTGGGERSEPPEPDYQLHLSWREVARYGLMFNGLLFLAPAIAPFTQNLGPALETWLLSLEETRAHQFFVDLISGNLAWLVAAGMVVAAVAGLVILFAISSVIALIRFYDYRLTRFGDQYQYRAGLGTVKTRGFRLHKLQQVTVTQGVVARLLKRYTLTMSKAGGATGGAEAQDSRRFLVPVLTGKALAEIETQLGIPTRDWRRVSGIHVLLRGTVAGSVLALVTVVLLSYPLMPLMVLLAYLVCFLFAWRYWWCLGIYQGNGWLAVRTGFIGSRVVWLPAGKAQKIAVSEPPWLKPLKLANLTVWGADGQLEMPCLPVTAATAMRDCTLYQVATFRGKWF